MIPSTIIARRKGGEGSGWFSPPRGTHTATLHRKVGSGTATKPSGGNVAQRHTYEMPGGGYDVAYWIAAGKTVLPQEVLDAQNSIIIVSRDGQTVVVTTQNVRHAITANYAMGVVGEEFDKGWTRLVKQDGVFKVASATVGDVGGSLGDLDMHVERALKTASRALIRVGYPETTDLKWMLEDVSFITLPLTEYTKDLQLYKGGEGSGWFAPPRGTHTGDKHREVGSGRASGGWKPGKRPDGSFAVGTLIRNMHGDIGVVDEDRPRELGEQMVQSVIYGDINRSTDITTMTALPNQRTTVAVDDDAAALAKSLDVDLSVIHDSMQVEGIAGPTVVEKRGPWLSAHTVWVDENAGERMGTMSVGYNQEEANFHIGFVRMEDSQQGKGVVQQVLVKQVGLARYMGADRLTLNANITIGRYAWAKYGFDYEFPSQALPDINARFKAWTYKNGIPEPSGGWKTFTSAIDVATYDTGQRVRPSGLPTFYNREVAADLDMHLGKAFMLDASGDGHGSWDGAWYV